MSAPPWLAELQRELSAVLRTPLDRSTGTLRATPHTYPPRARDEVAERSGAQADERLAVYNRQYWFRLFDALSSAYPLTRRLCGAWELNEHAARYLDAAPPRHWDLDAITPGFAAALAEVEWPAAAAPVMRQAITLDAAYLQLAAAPRVAPFVPTTEHAARLAEGRLRRSPAVAWVSDEYGLLALRQEVLRQPTETRLELPPRRDVGAGWALCARPGGTLQIALAPLELRLLRALERQPVGLAVAELERETEHTATQVEQVRALLARSVREGFWEGLELDEGPAHH